MESKDFHPLVFYNTPISDALLSNAEISSLMTEIIIIIERYEVDSNHPDLFGAVLQYIILKMVEYYGRSRTDLIVRRMLKATVQQEGLPA